MRKAIDCFIDLILWVGMVFITSVPCLSQNPFSYMGNVQPFETLFDIECIDTIVLKHGTSIEYYDKRGVYKKTVWHTKSGFTEENWKNGRWHGLFLEWSNTEGIKELRYCYLDRCYKVELNGGVIIGAGGDSVGRPRGDYVYYSRNGQLTHKGTITYQLGSDTLFMYHDNGLLAAKGLNLGPSWGDDTRIGQWEYYYPNGQLRLLSNYGYDLNLLPDDNYRWKEGLWKHYSEDGRLLIAEQWNKGELLERKEY